MKQIKLLVLGVFLVVAAGCSDHEHSDQGHSHDNNPKQHDSI